jgi:bifunctional non-homologous end joining protein LigD
MARTDPLETYRAKRDFTRTAEPSGKSRRKAAAKAGGGRFVIHKHDARRLHYDLRLEHDGVLWSWAVTRGPSLDPQEKRLAVHVEDHPLDYGDFEGNIPEGEYGAGSVIVWDTGTWTPEGDPAAGMKKGHLSFTLDGNKLKGGWHLVRLKPRRGEKRENWLLIKAEDAEAHPGGDILEDEPRSVVSGRTNDEVAHDRKAAVWDTSDAHPRADTRKTRATTAPKPAKAAPKPAADLPDFVPPELATLQSQPPSGPEWLHEVKFDGYRIQAALSGGKLRLHTRTGLDWTERFGKPIADALAALDCRSALIDGEIVVMGENGVASFSALQQALSEGRAHTMVFYAFDLLSLDGKDLRDEPLADRKEHLAALLGEAEGPLRYSEHFVEPGRTMLRHACRMGLEGVVSKRADAPYRSGRGKDWIKSKCTNRQEFVIVGYVPSDKTGRGLRSLLVGYNEGGRLRYGGRVGTGFSQRVGDDLKQRLDALKASKPAISPDPPGQKDAVWVEPDLVAEVEFGSWTSEGILRHASFQGLREDKPADEIVQEEPDDTKPAQTRQKLAAGTRERKGTAKVSLSNPDKLLWPEAGVSKSDLLAYYERVWPRMERFVVNRPLSLVRAPEGIGGQRFFQKHASKGMSDTISTRKDKDGEDLLFIRDFDGLAALVQLGTVEVHIWGAPIDSIETPDQIVFDLDPDEGLGIDHVRAATLDVKQKLEELGLPTFLKTSGGKGYHVMVPLKPKADWVAVKGFADAFAHALAQGAPDRYTATLSKKARAGRIFIDYLRNGRGSTTVAPYSARARTGATVSMPLPWKALDKTGPADFAMTDDSVAKALKAPDPWADFFDKGKPLGRKA